MATLNIAFLEDSYKFGNREQRHPKYKVDNKEQQTKANKFNFRSSFKLLYEISLRKFHNMPAYNCICFVFIADVYFPKP